MLKMEVTPARQVRSDGKVLVFLASVGLVVLLSLTSWIAYERGKDHGLHDRWKMDFFDGYIQGVYEALYDPAHAAETMHTLPESR